MRAMRKRVLLPSILTAIAAGMLAMASGGNASSSAMEQSTAKPTASVAAPIEPKHLQARVTIVMGENASGMYFANDKGKLGGTFTVPAGKIVGIKVVNRGALGHEIVFGRTFNATSGQYARNLFGSVKGDVFSFKPVKLEIGGATFGEIEVEAKGEVWIRATFPASMKGTWELGCLIEGHRESGMVAKLVIK